MQDASAQQSLDVCLTPALLHLHNISDQAVVIIDVFRATTSICVALDRGASEVIPVSSLEETFEYKDQGYLVGGERHGERIDGFDFGNSPREMAQANIQQKSLVLTTTNGTRALNYAREARQIYVGAFVNISTLAEYLKNNEDRVLLLCAGWRNSVNLEDTLFAGALIEALHDDFSFISDSALSTLLLYQNVKDDLLGAIKKGSHYARLQRRNAVKDVGFCLSRDVVDVIPLYDKYRLINLTALEEKKSSASG